MVQYSKEIKEAILNKKDSKKAAWLESYVKHNTRSLGVGIPELREIVNNYTRKTFLNDQHLSIQTGFLNDLMKSEYTEYKLAAILYIQKFWTNKPVNLVLDLVSKWFDNAWISDWNVCDWLCVKILTPLIDRSPDHTINVLQDWNNDKSVWKARASLVPFAQCKTLDRHLKTIEAFSIHLIKREERFCKTAVGWVLREYSEINPMFVRSFIEKYNNWTTNEVIKNSTKYLNKKQ